MSFEAALILAFFILIVTMVGMGALIGSRKQAAREEELKSAASARGWQFESKLEKGYRVHRWTGSTDGVSWVAESLRQAAGGNNASSGAATSRAGTARGAPASTSRSP